MTNLEVKKKRFDPENSYYHMVILNKYMRKGYSRGRAFKKARHEFLKHSKPTWI